MKALDNLPIAIPYGGSGFTPTLSGRIRVQGETFVTNSGVFRPLFASGLTLLNRSREDRLAFLDMVVNTGFNGVRVFAGALTWDGQTPAGARETLPYLLEEAEERGLYVEVTAITDSATDYDFEEHLRRVSATCLIYDNSLLEVANEYWHATQHERVQDIDELQRIALRNVPSSIPYAIGAPRQDEPENGEFPVTSGHYITCHLDRSRDKWNQVRRVRELEAVMSTTNKPVLNNEPIGANEVSIPGRRESDPAFFYALGALSRLFEVGVVFHSENGLYSRPWGPVQTECAKACVEGFRTLDTNERLRYLNVGWNDGTISSANWDNVVRAYSGVYGNDGYVVLVGLTGNPELEWQNGWHQVSVVGERPGVRILKIVR